MRFIKGGVKGLKNFVYVLGVRNEKRFSVNKKKNLYGRSGGHLRKKNDFETWFKVLHGSTHPFSFMKVDMEVDLLESVKDWGWSGLEQCSKCSLGHLRK